MDEELLVYEQDEVHTKPTSPEELAVAGRLRIIEKHHGVVIEWRCNDDETSTDSEWAVINAAAVTFTHHNTSDSVEIATSRRNVRPITIELIDLRSYTIGPDESLVLIQRDGTTHPALVFRSGDVSNFVEVLLRYVAVKKSVKDSNLFLVSEKNKASMDEKLSSLNLVPRSRHPGGVSTQQRVWGFINNMKKDPYTTALSTLSKVYDTVLYAGVEGYIHEDQGEEDVAEFLNSLNGLEDLEPGYEVLTRKGQLGERPHVDRLDPLNHDEYQQFVDVDGRVMEVNNLQQRIFRGGIHPSLRRELWCLLLGYSEWNSTFIQRHNRRKEKENVYFIMKQQWKTISADQESRFMAYRDRKSLIEKDVNRTDRNHPFYEGEKNPNVDLLHDVLMTYVMYNFDLGYVQGMSDLLAPILYVAQNEADAFWCFAGFMDRVYRNFDIDQSGMKQQLLDLHQLLRVVDPELMSYLEARDSSNLYFCFRWLLVRFKRELSYSNTLRLWEVLWTGKPCNNFHLLIAVALLDTEKTTIMENTFGFTEILKHINDISHRIDLESTLCKAEGIYKQIANSNNVPNSVRSIVGLPPLDPVPPVATSSNTLTSPGVAVRTSSPRPSGSNGQHQTEEPASIVTVDPVGYGGALLGVMGSMIGSAVRHLGGEENGESVLDEVLHDHVTERKFENALSHQFV
ncbi:TBC1 domain family member 15/17 isoform X2 [Oratosquilla oratoria]|uniref:TBC1 domain family member 15/17 isoform X2 n=1 Tax=Oratosquilla oratoria TaxID=337810 RepID=UPI003F765493